MGGKRQPYILPSVIYMKVNGEYVNYDDIPEETRAELVEKHNKVLTEVMNRHFEERPDLYHLFCQSETVKKYDAEHPI